MKLTKDEEREVIAVRDRISNLTDEIIEIDDEIVRLLTVEIATLTKKRAILENEQNILISRDVEICFHAAKETECTLTSEQWDTILKWQNYTCAGFPHGSCNKQFTLENQPTRDHIIPLSAGGGITFENVQALCRSCNTKKHTKKDKSLIVSWLD